MRIDKTLHNIIIWVFEYIIDLLILLPITMGIIKLIPYIHSLYSFFTIYITLSTCRIALLEYKRYCQEDINNTTGIIKSEKLTETLILIIISKIILILKFIVAFGILFIIKKLLG
jgi:hypothetical protein